MKGEIIMRITRMKCNHMTNPLGFTLGQPRLSWVTEATDAKTQEACRIQVASDESFNNSLFDSGRSESIDSISFLLPLELKPRTRYYWRVQVWASGNDVMSPVAWFETSKMDEAWTAHWITPDNPKPHPLISKEFSIQGNVASARVYVSGLGLYEMEINGERVGDEYFTPFCNDYDKWIQYQTYDVTAMLQQGDNAIGVMLGNGWYKGRFGFSGHNENIYGDKFALLCELMITFKDGSQQVIITDISWKSTAGPVLESNIYDGEVQDANKVIVGWSNIGTDRSTWQGVTVIDPGMDRVEARRSIPVRIMEEIKPIEIITTPKGETVIDMGQNMVGWLKIKVDLPKGTELFLQHGEVMQDDCFYRDNLRTAKAEFKYICDGKPAIVQPYFTFYGFRFVKIEGWQGTINLDDFTGCVVYSDMERLGSIETSNPLVNKLFLNALWGQKGNFLDVPTDCPQRDERMGWTGDAQVFCSTASFNMDTYAFFNKYLYDLAREQEELNGMVPMVIPAFKEKNGGSTAWGEAATVIPWQMYLHYGDKTILEQQFDSMKGWVDFIRTKDDGSRLWNTGFHFGDWLALDGPSQFSPMGGTPNDLIASGYYSYSADLVAKAATVIGKEDIAKEYAQLAEEVREAILKEFFTLSGRLAVDTQTAYVIALFMNLTPEQFRTRVADTLKKKLGDKNNHLTTGFVGTPYLCRVLSENGYNNLAYTLLMNDDYPSWLYAVKMGATTIWERWNSILPDGRIGETGMNSLNHYSYGSIAEWMYRNMCGINPVEDCPGFRKVRLAPQPYGLIKWAKAKVDSVAGLYESGWRIKEEGLYFEFTIPFNAIAELTLPDALLSRIIVNGKALAASGLSAMEKDGNVDMTLSAGKYSFHYEPTKAYILRFSTQNNLQQLLGNHNAKAVLEKHLPEIIKHASAGMMGQFGSAPLRELAKNPFVKISDEVLDQIDVDLKGIEAWD